MTSTRYPAAAAATARRAATDGLVVIDDPESILTCSNKVYLAELLARKKILILRTLVVDRSNIEAIVSE